MAFMFYEMDNLSSGYSSSTAELSAFLPMSADEMMDTEDYELYNPRVQGLRNRQQQPGAVIRCAHSAHDKESCL